MMTYLLNKFLECFIILMTKYIEFVIIAYLLIVMPNVAGIFFSLMILILRFEAIIERFHPGFFQNNSKADEQR